MSSITENSPERGSPVLLNIRNELFLPFSEPECYKHMFREEEGYRVANMVHYLQLEGINDVYLTGSVPRMQLFGERHVSRPFDIDLMALVETDKRTKVLNHKLVKKFIKASENGSVSIDDYAFMVKRDIKAPLYGYVSILPRVPEKIVSLAPRKKLDMAKFNLYPIPTINETSQCETPELRKIDLTFARGADFRRSTR